MKLRNTIKIATAVFSLVGCGESIQVNNIERGMVISIRNTSEPVYEDEYSCNPSINFETGDVETDCGWESVYKGEEPTTTVSVAGCLIVGRQTELASAEQLELASTYRTDFTVTAEGSVTDAQLDSRTNCGATIEIDRSSGNRLKVGQLLTIDYLEEHRI